MSIDVTGDASRGTDYRLKVDGTTITGNTVTIPAGRSSLEVTLEVIDDDVREYNIQQIMILKYKYTIMF